MKQAIFCNASESLHADFYRRVQSRDFRFSESRVAPSDHFTNDAPSRSAHLDPEDAVKVAQSIPD
jgi:hypothetical protein